MIHTSSHQKDTVTIYIYIYIHTHICVHIYMCVYKILHIHPSHFIMIKTKRINSSGKHVSITIISKCIK